MPRGFAVPQRLWFKNKKTNCIPLPVYVEMINAASYKMLLTDINGYGRKVPRALYQRDGATLDDLRDAVNTIQEIEPTARRVLGGTHQTAAGLARSLQESRAALVAREESSGGA